MKTFLYQENTIALLKLLKRQIPKRIFSDSFIRVVFDYVYFQIAISPDVFVAASQNKFDEVIKAQFKRIDAAFQPNEHDKLLFENKAIDRLLILRTMIYFTDYISFGSSEVEASKHSKKIETETNPVLANLMRQSPGVYEEIVCHPQSAEAKSVNREFTNLVDVGIMLEIDNKLLMCFSSHNGFGVVGEIMSPEEIKEDVSPFYEFVEI